MTELEELTKRLEAKEAELLKTKLELIEVKICDLQQHDADQEGRLRIVEVSRTRFETLVWLAFGGGAISLFNIMTEFLKR